MYWRTLLIGAAVIGSFAGGNLSPSQPADAQVLKRCVFIAVDQRTGRKIGTYSARGAIKRIACRRAKRKCNRSISRYPNSLRVRCRRAS
jgi:hypothetical protein